MPAASPSAFTTQGARASSSRAAVDTPAACHHLFGEGLRALDAGGGGARAEDREAGLPQLIRRSGDERRLRADHGEVDPERATELDEALHVVRTHRMAAAVTRDPGVTGGGVQLCQSSAADERASERMLTPTRADEQDLH